MAFLQATLRFRLMEFTLSILLYGLSYGLLLFMLSAGLTIIFSLMGVLSFAHGSFYMLGGYAAYAVSGRLGFWPALLIAPLAVGAVGALVERYGLRRVHRYGQAHQLLFTFGLSFVFVQTVQLIWGFKAKRYMFPPELQGPMFFIYATPFPRDRVFVMAIALFMLAAVWLLLTRTRFGLAIQAALTHPHMVESLGHNVPRIGTMVFAGGCALAGLAGVIGGTGYNTSPGMGATMGSIVFVVIVIGGMGSLAGAFAASLLIGVFQTVGVTLNVSMLDLLAALSLPREPGTFAYPVLATRLSDIAPILPYLLMIVVLVLRPRGLMGKREG